MSNSRRIWKHPQLVVVARSRSEEQTLSACKIFDGLTTGYATVQDGCWYSVSCTWCRTLAAS